MLTAAIDLKYCICHILDLFIGDHKFTNFFKIDHIGRLAEI